MSAKPDETNASNAPTRVFEIGDLLNDTYEIRGVLGEGAMGQVFDAHDRKLNRRVAIKAPWPHLTDSAIRNEAQAMAAIRHPGLVMVHAVNVQNDIEYVVMERLVGVSLASFLETENNEGRPLSVDRTLELLIALTDALTAVHNGGLTHRDLKPANVMLCGGDRLVLVDFGLFLPQFNTGPQAKIMGSPFYMAPEVIRNQVAPGEGHLVDLYALGIIAFEMLTGDPPFVSDDTRVVLRGHLRDEVPDLTLWRRDAPTALVALIRELLSKAPRERPQSAEAVLWNLRSILSRYGSGPREKAFLVLVATHNPALERSIVGSVRQSAPDADVRVARDADSVIEVAQRRPPALAFIDPTIPELNPLELCMLLYGEGQCAIALLGDAGRAEERALFAKLGVQRRIPLDGDIAERVVETILDVRRGLTLA
ncbi:MAG: serine/threonine-protein kinase [Polyangiaceae bacterium]